jgi:hypothetical protein
MYYGIVYNKYADTPLSFVKGLKAALNETSLPVEPFESYVRIFHSDKEEDIETYWVKDGKGSLWGQLGHCYELINWATNGLYWGDELKKANEEKTLKGPTEFTVHIWKQIDEYNLETVYDLTFKGVKWESVSHADNQGSSDCWGLARFTYTDKIKNENYQAMECHIPSETKYPMLYYGKLMPKFAVPK